MRHPAKTGAIGHGLLLLAIAAFGGGCASGKVAGSDATSAGDRSKPPRSDSAVPEEDGSVEPPDFQWPDAPPADGPARDAPRDTVGPVDARRDTTPPDTSLPDLSPSAPNIGTVCTGGTSDPVCKNGAQCLLQVGASFGICTMTCTQDDPNTVGTDEDSCPDKARNICGEVPLSSGSSLNYCLQRCVPKSSGNDCPKELACSPGSTTITGKVATAACLYPVCATASDCPVGLSSTCSVTTLTGCNAGEICVPVSTTTAYCALPGSCNTTNGLCGPHAHGSATAKIGDPCAQDTDCGSAMFCLPETTTTGGVAWRNGYCTTLGCAFPLLGAASCPSGSTCSLVYSPGLCLRSCNLATATDCRGVSGDKLGDYECYAWNNFTIGGQSVASGPVCDRPAPCTLVASCESLGTAGNPTAMSCRDPQTNTNVTSSTPGSLCLDNTAAGPLP